MDPVEIKKWEAMEARLMKKLRELKDTMKLDMKQALGSTMPSPTPTTYGGVPFGAPRLSISSPTTTSLARTASASSSSPRSSPTTLAPPAAYPSPTSASTTATATARWTAGFGPDPSAASGGKVLPSDLTCIASTQKVFDEMPSHQETTTTGVLRVIVNQVLYPVTEEVLHQVFDPLGVVENVYVYERTDRVAALVAFRSCHEAAQAQEARHGRCIYDGCCWLDIELLIVPSSTMVTPAKFSTSHLSHDAGMPTAATTPTVAENGMVHHQISAPSLPSTTSDREDNGEFTSEQAPLVCYAVEQSKLRHHKPLTEEDVRRAPERRPRQVELRQDCPYLDTVNLQVLDFDFEKFCSISLSNLNVYACLVCGKYYQGRGLKSHAYTHSLEAGHHVFINLQTEKVYCLPDKYEINDPSLDDIQHVLNPRFTREKVLNLDKNKQWSRALDGSNYLPGMVGLNNIKETDFVNVTIQSLMRVTPLRNFFLIPENYQHSKSPLVHRFGELTRKIWHARNFKGQVSPHEFLQAVMKASDKRFQIGVQSDPVEFMSWLLNTLHAKLKSSKKKNRSIIHDCFQGELEVVKEIHRKHIMEKKEDADEQNGEAGSEVGTSNDGVVTETSRVPFLMLGLDLPPPPLFKDAMEKNIIPQVPLFNILKKFDGETVTEVVRPSVARMRYRVIRLPKYQILHMRRFTKNNFFIEKNPTLVNFPVKNLELKDYIPLPNPKESEKLRSKYDLIANIVHDGKPGEGCYRVFVQRKAEEAWYEMQDLHVTETLPQMVALSETYMQIYEQHE